MVVDGKQYWFPKSFAGAPALLAVVAIHRRETVGTVACLARLLHLVRSCPELMLMRYRNDHYSLW